LPTQEFFRPDPAPPTVPDITVKLTNSGESDVSVVIRSDFILWLTGGDAQRAMGKYELRRQRDNQHDNGQVTLKPGATLSVSARLMNQNLFGRVLQQGDCDLSFIVRRSDGSVIVSDHIAFTATAIEKYFIPVEVSVEPPYKTLHRTR
jgi:hypothetical protein